MARRAAPTEIEVKFPGRDARHVAILLGALGVGPNRSGRSERVRDVYLDTEERAVLATGYGLRIRHRERGAAEATLKALAAPDAAGIVAREERTEPLPPGATDLRLLPDGPLRATIAAAVGGRALLPLARVTGRRTRHLVSPEPGLRVEVCDDRVVVAVGRTRVVRREVEVELLDGTRAAFAAWVGRAAARARTRPSTLGSKLEAGLRAARIPIPSPARIAAGRLVLAPAAGPGEPASRAAAQALARLALALAAAVAAARRGAIEGVHDVRTVSRRLRAALAAFREEVPDADRRDLRARLAALRRAAGPVRDLDVVREALHAAEGAVEPAGLTALRQVAAARRRRERTLLSAALAGPDLTGLADRVADAASRTLARDGPPLAVAGFGRFPAALEPMLARRAAIAGPLAPAAGPLVHALRIAVKRARYAVETFLPAFGKPVARFAAAARALQDGLGALQDARAVADGVRALARGARGDRRRAQAAARAAAAIVEAAERRAERARRGFDRLAAAVLAPAVLRDVVDHVAKRAAAATTATR